MMPEALPACLCGSHDWQGCGGSFGGLMQSNFKCGPCSRFAVYLSDRGGNLLMIMKTPGVGLSERVRNWFDSTIQGVWRDNLVHHESQPGLPDAPIPPRVPGDEIVVWILRCGSGDAQFLPVDAAETQDLTVPPDPIRVGHDAYFKEVFEAVGLVEHPLVEIPNQYYRDASNNEPWYEFQLGAFKLTVGPRKRVISISIQSETPFDTKPLRALGMRDNVTYDADEGATSALIHAWNKAKTIEYLNVVLSQIIRVKL